VNERDENNEPTESIRVVTKRVGQPPAIEEFVPTPKEMRRRIGGMRERFRFGLDRIGGVGGHLVDLWMDEEGLLKERPANIKFPVFGPTIVGDLFFAGFNETGPASLSEQEVQFILSAFEKGSFAVPADAPYPKATIEIVDMTHGEPHPPMQHFVKTGHFNALAISRQLRAQIAAAPKHERAAGFGLLAQAFEEGAVEKCLLDVPNGVLGIALFVADLRSEYVRRSTSKLLKGVKVVGFGAKRWQKPQPVACVLNRDEVADGIESLCSGSAAFLRSEPTCREGLPLVCMAADRMVVQPLRFQRSA
jgi:hypothetical protein